MNTLRSLMSATLLALALAAPSAQAADENPWKFEFHGWVTGSMYYQDQAFASGQGQGLLYAAPSFKNNAPCEAPATCVPPGAAPGDATKSGSIISGDVRNSRFSFSMSGPKVFTDAQPRAYLELDFFGPNGAGAFGSEQPLPRLRIALAELKMGATTIQVGQQNQLVVVQIPGSLSHIANPVTYGAGTIGWRTPGIRVSHGLNFDGTKLELAAEAVKNKWSNEAVNALGGNGGGPYTSPAGTPGANSPATVGMGEASGMPMFQARAKLDGKAGDLAYMAYVVGVYHKIDLAGFGGSYTPPTPAGATAPTKTITGTVVEVGGKLTYAPVALSFNWYTGKATANMLGSMLTFGDISDMGYWVQLGGNFTKELSLNIAYGADKPNETDTRAWGGARLGNTVLGGMLKYQDGGYALGVEYWSNTTTFATGANTDKDNSAMQVIGTVGYFF